MSASAPDHEHAHDETDRRHDHRRDDRAQRELGGQQGHLEDVDAVVDDVAAERMSTRLPSALATPS